MSLIRYAALASLAAAPALAQEHREMGAHVHGVSKLELAMEGAKLSLNLHSPGADIVGFEYPAKSDDEKDAVEAAIRAMLAPENIVTLPEDAHCRLAEALAHLHSHEHDHDESDEHAEGHDDHDDHEGDHDDHDDHEEHEGGAQHSEFHARYEFTCEHPDELVNIGFPFFSQFPNAVEIEAAYVTATGAGAAEIHRDEAELSLK